MKNKNTSVTLTYRNYRILLNMAAELVKADPEPKSKAGKRLKCIVDLIVQYEDKHYKF